MILPLKTGGFHSFFTLMIVREKDSGCTFSRLLNFELVAIVYWDSSIATFAGLAVCFSGPK